MNKKKHMIKGGIIGLLISLILLTISIIAYHTTVTITLIEEKLSFFFMLFSILYSWPFLILAYILNIFDLTVESILILIIVSTGTYVLIGMYWQKIRHNKKRKK